MRWMRGKHGQDRRAYRSSSQVAGSLIVGLFFDFLFVGFLIQPKNQPTTGIFGGLFILATTLAFGRLAWSAVFLSIDGIHVANLFAGFDLEWTEIERFEIGRWKFLPYVCLIHLTDGRVLHATGIQERTNFRNGSAEAVVEELNQELRKHFPDGVEARSKANAPGSAQEAHFRASTELSNS